MRIEDDQNLNSSHRPRTWTVTARPGATDGVAFDTRVVHLRLPSDAARRPHRVLLVPSAPSVAAALRPLRAWYARDLPPMPVPEGARTPVHFTWYAFNQDVTAAEVEARAALAAPLGCGTLVLDDGWQQYGHGRG
ncbi:hypothetical protein ACFV7Q_26565 [Streptomyces sp. NPDC059851]|uniref:hypothetical protein n=1 Tax=Streptomyces sp. NPDC059851 TaxID=3346971 RepID=UPI0036693254